MKKIFAFLFLVSVVVNSCTFDESISVTCEDTLVCENGCLFLLVNQAGQTSLINCYDTWGILFKEDQEYDRIALIADMPDEYQLEGKEVIFSAAFFENDIPFLFPDPPGPAQYKLELCDIKAQD